MLFHSAQSLFRDFLASGRRDRSRRSVERVPHVAALEDRKLLAADANDQLSEAFGLGAISQVRSSSGFSIEAATDVDMFSFSVVAGQRVQFDIDRPSGGLDSVIRLFNSSGIQLQINDDGSGPGEATSTESFLDLNFNVGGTYYLGVSGYGNSSYNAVTGNGDSNGSTGAFNLIVTPFVTTSTDTDDQIIEAASFGAISTTRSTSGYSIQSATDVDMFSFSVTAGQRVQFDIDRPSGSLDSVIRLFNSSGTQLQINDDGSGPGEAASTESFLDVTFNVGGTYYLGVSGYGNSAFNASTGAGDTNGSAGAFNLVITPVTASNTNRGTLYLNFEGVNLTNAQLRSWAGTDWAGSVSGYLDPEGNGISVTRFLNGQAARDAVITGIISMLQADLSQYGIAVQRTTGLAVTGVGATTIFFGRHNMANIPHVASDVDYNNNNRTDIAFVQDENWGSTSSTTTALSDVALHEAGHTWGLFHVNSTVGGTIYNESMGLRYSTQQTEWVRNTSFMNQTFTEYQNHGGGRGSQNSHQTMLRNFGFTASSTAAAEPRFTPIELREMFAMDALMHGDGEHEDHDHEADLLDSDHELVDVLSHTTTDKGTPVVVGRVDSSWLFLPVNLSHILWN